jgi:hypothetical protein
MSTDPETLPPVPAEYGTLDGDGPGTGGIPRQSRRRIRSMGRDRTDSMAGDDPESMGGDSSVRGDVVGPGPATDPEFHSNGGAPDPKSTAAAAPVVEGRGLPEAPILPAGYAVPGGPGFSAPDRTGPFGPPVVPPGRRSLRDRIEDRREARAAEIPDGSEQYVPRRFGRDKVRVVRGRRSRRIVRRIDTWTVLKVSLVFYLCALIVVLISGVVLWNVSQAFNFTHDIEKSVKTLFGYNTFTLHPKPMFEYTALAGAILAVVGTLFNLLVALVYNLISDVVGGIQIIVVTEDI